MPIDLNQKIQEFGDNADRVDQWVNDPEKYVDKNGQDVKSIPKLIEELNVGVQATAVFQARDQVESDRVDVAAAKVATEVARDAAFVNADVYESTVAGLLATTEDQQFQVVDGDEIVRYRHDPGPIAFEVARYQTNAAVDAIDIRVEDLEAQFVVSSGSAIGGSASALPAAPLEYRRITLSDGSRVSIPVYTTVEPLDLFIIVGQSNAEGRGDSAQSPTAPEGVYIAGSTITAPLADPVGGADTGSMWPAWSNEWFARTGRMSAFVEAAQGGTGVLADAGGQWSPAGSLRAAAVSAANSAITAINASSEFELGNLYFVWCQGENEAAAINGTTVTAALYKDALKALVDYFKAQLPTMQDFFVVATGITGITGPLLTQTVLNYADIRQAQFEASTENALIVPVYDGTVSFPAKLLMEDSVHYSQAGLNLVGKVAARAAAGNGFVPQAPAVLASTAYADIVDANKTTRTIAHTVAPGAKTAILIVQGSRVTTFPTITATYGGISLSPICSARVQNVSPNNRMVAFVIKDLEGLPSADFVISSTLSLVNLHASVIEFADDVWLTGIGSNISTLDNTAQAHDVFSGSEATVISAVSTQSVAAASVSFVGATELEEMSLFRTAGALHHTLAIASAAVAAISDTTIETSHSSSCSIINAFSLAFRKAFPDESI